MTKRQVETIKEGVRLAGVSLAVAVAAVLIILFFSRKINGKVNDISGKRNDFNIFSKRQEVANQLKTNSAQAGERIAKLEALLPTWDNAMTVINYLNAIGAQSNNIVSVRTGSSPSFSQELTVGTLDFSADITGTKATLLDFLKKLDKAGYLITVKNMSVAFTNGQDSQLTAKISGVIYLRKD